MTKQGISHCSCKGILEESNELVFFKGKTIVAKATKCKKCGKVYFSPQEATRVRKELNPTLLDRITSYKNFFNYLI